ncbi:tripartite tricarboxylate transporter TctB family protein [Marinobacter sp.]|uniref:tripartite tricarboxylate transporter TctB family protein n=1 Tax=Marinobacter sp. TaxID=50741 RepID=UPI002B268397|nr:tripartite tricarboxylate transporter TctB family protein [Marinobacter sp.]
METSEIHSVKAMASRHGRLNPNSVLGGAFCILAAIFLFYVVPTHINMPPYMQHALLSPRFLPQVAGWLVFSLSFLLMIDGIMKPPKRAEADELRRGVPLIRQALLLAAGVIYAIFFEELGAMGSGILASAFLFLASGLRGLKIYALVIVFPVVVTLLFIYVLNVPLPVGTLWEMIFQI